MLNRARWERLPPLWLFAIVGGVAVVVAGVLPVEEAAHTLERVGPVLAFVVLVTVLAELSAAAGVFDAAADSAARLAGGRTWLLFLLLVGLATASTILLSLDTTAVLLTPVVLSICVQLQLPPLPFAMSTVWLANTASLLLPVSNVTNLLALRSLGLSTPQFAARMAAPATVSILLTTAVLVGLHHRQLRGTYQAPLPPQVQDGWLFGLCTAAIATFVGLVLVGVDPPIASGVSATMATAAFFARNRRVAWTRLVPWRLVLTVTGLFLVVEALHRHGLGAALTAVAGEGADIRSLLQLGAVGALGANLVNNLPAYLALEPDTVGSPERLMALLIGVNVGPVVTLWGSLATLLWLDRCRSHGLQIRAPAFAGAGLVLVPGAVVCAVTALALF